MEHNVVVRMAKVLYGMVLAVFVFNLLVLPLVPGYTMMAYEGMGMGHPSISSLMGTMRSLLGAGVPAWEILVVRPLAMLGGDWSGYGPEVWWSAAFFLGCGICTAVLLWQARCILSTIIERAAGAITGMVRALPEGALRLTTAGHLSESAPEKRAGEGPTSVLAEGPLPR